MSGSGGDMGLWALRCCIPTICGDMVTGVTLLSTRRDVQNSKLSEHFTRDELACRCCGRLHQNHAALVVELEKLRAAYGEPLIITSGYRCTRHNVKVGGATNSRHLAGDAVDIATPTPEHQTRLLMAAKRCGGWNGVGIASTFVHLDRRDTPAKWLY